MCSAQSPILFVSVCTSRLSTIEVYYSEKVGCENRRDQWGFTGSRISIPASHIWNVFDKIPSFLLWELVGFSWEPQIAGFFHWRNASTAPNYWLCVIRPTFATDWHPPDYRTRPIWILCGSRPLQVSGSWFLVYPLPTLCNGTYQLHLCQTQWYNQRCKRIWSIPSFVSFCHLFPACLFHLSFLHFVLR